MLQRCWICREEPDEDEKMCFDMEFDTFYHPDCLPEGIETILEYERQRTGEHTHERR